MVQGVLQTRTTTFSRLIATQGTVLLDGGLATELEAQGLDITGPLWSAALLQRDPEAIVKAHCAYIAAGAQCIETASYQASQEGFDANGLPCPQAEKLMRLAIDLALRARDDCGTEVVIAASLGPYGALRHDGSEYHGNYGVDDAQLREFHRKRLALFDTPDVDVIAMETIPSMPEARILDALLRDCTTPALIAVLRQSVPGKAIIAYPNSGETYHAGDNRWTGTVTPGDCASAAEAWVRAGAKIAGGCCRTGPSHISAMGAMLNRMR